MKKLLGILAALALSVVAGMSPAKADVVLQTQLSGTGDNVIFEGLFGNLALGSFNGQHTGLVDFTDLSGNPLFTGAANGNDIKISNTNDLQVQVFASDGTTVLGTSTQVFSLKGTGDVFASVQATDGIFTFDLGQIDPNAQSGFTLTAINGEVMTLLTLLDVGGIITDYEHYRIDVAAAVSEVPIPPAVLLFASGLGGLWALGRRRKKVMQPVAA